VISEPGLLDFTDRFIRERFVLPPDLRLMTTKGSASRDRPPVFTVLIHSPEELMRIRYLIAVIVAVIVAATLISLAFTRICRQANVATAVWNSGGTVYYSTASAYSYYMPERYQSCPGRLIRMEAPPTPVHVDPHRRTVLHRLLGQNIFDTVYAVELGPDYTTTTIRQLRYLSRLRHLDLSQSGIGDNDLPYLKELKNLRSMNIRQTRLTNDAARSLQQSLPDCEVCR
jgi:hypothetical protein